MISGTMAPVPPAFTYQPRRPWLLVALLLLVLGAVFAYFLSVEYALTLSRERDSLRAHARVVDDNLGQQLVGANAALSNVCNEAAALVDGGQMGQLSRRLTALSDAMPGVRTMLVTDAQGKVLASSRPELIGVDVSQRPYFQIPKARPAPETLHVSEPFKSVLDVFSLGLVKVWIDSTGKFGGIVSATLDPAYFEVLLRSVLSAKDAQSSLIHGNGVELVRMPHGATMPAAAPPDTAAWLAQHRTSGRTESLFGDEATSFGQGWMLSFRTTQPADLHMDQPLIATVGRPVATVLAPWRSLATQYGLMYLLLAATVIGAVRAWLRGQLALVAMRHANEIETREQSERLTMALAGGDLGLWDLDLHSGTRTVNARAQEMVGLPPDAPAEDIVQWARRVHPDDLDNWQAARAAHVAGSAEALVADYRARHQDGHWVWIHSRGKVMQWGGDGRALRMTGTYQDVTDLKHAQAQIERSAQLLASMSRVSRTGGWSFDIETGTSTWSEQMFRIHEMDTSVVPDREAILGAFLPESRALLVAARAAAIEHQTPWDMELQMSTDKGNVYWVRSQGEAVVENGRTVALTGTLKNVTWRKQSQIDLKSANDTLERMALSDGLTGIGNRRLFDQTLQTEWLRSARARQPLSLLMVDIDHFKLYNDHYGHAGGDDCLRLVAQLLAGCSRRAGDLVCRFGGEEFALLLPATDLANASRVAGTCLDAIRDAQIVHAASPLGPWLSLSIGVASVEVNAALAAQSLIERADAALYQAKRLGRNRYEKFNDGSTPGGTP